MAQAPYEIIGNPAQIYIAAVGTSFPTIAASPAVAWKLLGKNGNRNTSNDGVKIMHTQKIELVRPDGATGPVKAFRAEEDLMIELTIWDLTLEMYRFVLNGITPTTISAASGIPGEVSLPMARGSDVTQFAALLRGPSPYGDGWYTQYEIPVVVETGNPTVQYVKAKPAGLLVHWQAMEDLNAAPEARFGTLRAQNAAAL